MGARVTRTYHKVLGVVARVHCHACLKSVSIDTVEAALKDTWPVCCGAPMEIENPSKRGRRKGTVE